MYLGHLHNNFYCKSGITSTALGRALHGRKTLCLHINACEIFCGEGAGDKPTKQPKRTNELICLWFFWQLKSNQERQPEKLRAVAFTLRQMCWAALGPFHLPPLVSAHSQFGPGHLQQGMQQKPAGFVFPGRTAGGSRARSSGERGNMPKAAPEQGRHSSSLRHLCVGTGTAGVSCRLLPTAGDSPAHRVEPAAIGAVQVFPIQSNKKAVATLKSLKSNHLEGKLWLGYISGYHNRSQMLGCDKITYCKNKVITRLGYL